MRCHFSLLALLTGLLLCGAEISRAQTFTVLHSFSNTSNPYKTNSDGANPASQLIISGNTLYGVAEFGGLSKDGAVFRINTDGSGFTNLHNFVQTDGVNPRGGLVLSNTTLYGTTLNGGASIYGSIFSLQVDGSAFQNLHSFNGTDGAYPYGSMVLTNGVLYGTTQSAGYDGAGSVFRINSDGSSFTNLYTFSGGDDGDYPYAGLIFASNILYGTTAFGAIDFGTVFAISNTGTGFTNLHSFSPISSDNVQSNSDGAYPFDALLSMGNVVYGTADAGGLYGQGVLFKMNLNGTGFTNLYNFIGGTSGARPLTGVIVSDGILYGTTAAGGTASNGTVYQINLDGTGYKTLHSFSALTNGMNQDGSDPDGGLVLNGGVLYGTTAYGGSGTNGTVFSINLTSTPTSALKIAMQGKQVILYTPPDAVNYVLQMNTSLSSTNWVTLSNAGPGTALYLTNNLPLAFFRLYPK